MSRARDAAKWEVYIGGSLSANARVLRVEEHLNGHNLDSAEIEIDPRGLAEEMQNLKIKPGMTPVIEIKETFGGRTYVRHWGKLASKEFHLDQAGPRLRIMSRMEPWHFGYPLIDITVRDPVKKQLFFATLPHVFNPVIDGQVEGNCSPEEPKESFNYFLDPESCRTDAATKLHGGKKPVMWTLAKAVYYLCKSLNVKQTYVSNPTYDELVEAFKQTEEQHFETRIRAVPMQFGDHLPECLDKLLLPLGFIWHVDRSGATKKLKFLRKGTGGRAKEIKYQAFGSTFDNRSTEAENFTLRFAANRLVNAIAAYGSYERVEFTAVCVRTWSVSQDAKTSEELHAGVANFEDVQNAYRKWVIDTAGDYVDTRPENLTKRFPLEKIFDPSKKYYVPRRRKLGPCLTLGADDAPIGTIQGVYVEYSNPLFNVVLGEPEWLPIGNWGCALLEHEAGVYFRGDFVPDEILSQGTDAKIRITATLDSDQRMTAYKENRSSSPNTDPVYLTLDMDDRFVNHHHVAAGEYKSRFFDDYVAKRREANTGSDQLIAEGFVTELQKSFDAGEVSGPIVLEGCDYDFQLGDRITAIPGLNINLLCNPADYPLQYPQVAAITYDPQNQTTTLQLERFKSDVRTPDGTRMRKRRKR